MTIHAGILSSLPTDVTSFKLAAFSFSGGIALITVILLINTIVDATASVLRPLTRRKPSSFGPLHDPNALWGSRAPFTRSVLPPMPWVPGASDAHAAAFGTVDDLRPLGTPGPVADRVPTPTW